MSHCAQEENEFRDASKLHSTAVKIDMSQKVKVLKDIPVGDISDTPFCFFLSIRNFFITPFARSEFRITIDTYVELDLGFMQPEV